MNWSAEAKRVVIEIISTLVNIKHTMAEIILKPAGIPPSIYNPLLNQRDPATGRQLSKRQIAPLIIDAISSRPDVNQILRSIIEIAAKWNSFHLAKDEYLARASVQKAREILGLMEEMEIQEKKRMDSERKKELARKEAEDAKDRSVQSDLLLQELDEVAKLEDHRKRGYLLQDFLTRIFDLHEITIVRPFTRNEGAEQIDGAFKIEGWHYLVECRWREKLANIREIDGLMGQVDRSGRQTMGLFLSMNGWSKNVPPLLKQNPVKSIILMDGYDLRTVLSRQLNLSEFIQAKITKLNLESEPFLSVTEYLKNMEL